MVWQSMSGHINNVSILIAEGHRDFFPFRNDAINSAHRLIFSRLTKRMRPKEYEGWAICFENGDLLRFRSVTYQGYAGETFKEKLLSCMRGRFRVVVDFEDKIELDLTSFKDLLKLALIRDSRLQHPFFPIGNSISETLMAIDLSVTHEEAFACVKFPPLSDCIDAL